MQLLEGLKEDFGLVYSQGRRHTFKPSGFAQKLGSLHIKGRVSFINSSTNESDEQQPFFN